MNKLLEENPQSHPNGFRDCLPGHLLFEAECLVTFPLSLKVCLNNYVPHK